MGNISIHAPPRGATRAKTALYCNHKISIHAPPRGATTVASTRKRLRNFNSRPSARGDADADVVFQRFHEFQFTPLREGRRLLPRLLPLRILISIHAPPRGATAGCAFFVPPAPVFQFTPLREGRQEMSAISQHFENISIHAPPRGATQRRVHASSSSSFQFTPLREGRRSGNGTGTKGGIFQFTPLREGRQP